LRSVFVGYGIAKADQPPVAQILRDMPLEAVAHLNACGLILPPDLAPLFRVEPLCERGGAHETTKHHRHLAPLGRSGSGLESDSRWGLACLGLGQRPSSLACCFRCFALAALEVRGRPCSPHRGAACRAKLGLGQIFTPTAWAAVLESTVTLDTKLGPFGSLRVAACPAHATSLPLSSPLWQGKARS